VNIYTDTPTTEKVKRTIREACYRREGKMLELFERQSHLIREGRDEQSVIYNYGSDDNEYEWQAEYTDILEKVAKK
jgi:hypothetical protein